MTAAPNGMSIFPFSAPTQPIPPEFLQDTIVQLLELIAAQVAPAGNAVGSTGTFTLNGATPVTVANAAIDANSQVLVTLKTVGGTVGTSAPNVRTITAGTGFTIAGIASDTSVYNYAIIG
jgi:hypothetical protein